MHSYSCDQKSYKWVVVSIFVLSVAIAYGYHLLSVKLDFTLPWYIETPSIFGVYGLIAWLYDIFLWKKRVLGIKLSRIPIYEGVWEGCLISSYDKDKEIPCTLEIKQSWRSILCKLRTETSESYSCAARIESEAGVDEGIMWLYENRPLNSAPKDMHSHCGVAHGKIGEDGKMVCNYFNCSRDRPTYGTITLERVS